MTQSKLYRKIKMNNVYYNMGHHIVKPYRGNEESSNDAKNNIASKSILDYPEDKYSNMSWSYDTVVGVDNTNTNTNYLETINGDTASTRAGSNNSYSVSFGRPSVIHSFSNRILSH